MSSETIFESSAEAWLAAGLAFALRASESASRPSRTISLRWTARASGSLQSISGFSGAAGSMYYQSRSGSPALLVEAYPSERSSFLMAPRMSV